MDNENFNKMDKENFDIDDAKDVAEGIGLVGQMLAGIAMAVGAVIGLIDLRSRPSSDSSERE